MPSVFSFTGLGGHFAVNRGYIAGVCSSWVSGSTAVLSGDVWRITGVYGGVTTYEEYVFYHNFLQQNTNTYTPDHFVIDHYYINEPSPTHINPLPINVKLKYHPITFKLYINIDSLGFPDLYYLDLPSPTPVWPH